MLLLIGWHAHTYENSGLERTKVTVGVQAFEDYAPYSSYVNDQYLGFNRDLMDAYAAEQNYLFEYQAMPLKRLYHYFLNDELDLKYPDNPAWSKAQKEGHDITYSRPVVSFIDGVAVLKENLNKPKASLDRLGILSGYTPRPYLNDIATGVLRTEEAKSIEALVKQLVSKRVDGIYINITVLNSFLQNHPDLIDAVVFNPSLPYLKDSRYLSSKNKVYLILDFNRFLKNNQELVKRLKRQHNLLDAEDILKQQGDFTILSNHE